MNHIDVMGNLVKDVEVRFTSNQKAIALFTIAENCYNFKTKEKEPQFFMVTAFGKKAEVIADHFSKGDKIKVDGHMDFVSYTDAEGSKHEYWRILLEDFEFCERKRPKEKKEKDA